MTITLDAQQIADLQARKDAVLLDPTDANIAAYYDVLIGAGVFYGSIAKGVVLDNTFAGILANNFTENKLTNDLHASFTLSEQQDLKRRLVEADFNARQNRGFQDIDGEQISRNHDDSFSDLKPSLPEAPQAWAPFAVVRVTNDFSNWLTDKLCPWIGIGQQMWQAMVFGNETNKSLASGWLQDMLPSSSLYSGDNVFLRSMSELLAKQQFGNLANQIEQFSAKISTAPLPIDILSGAVFLVGEGACKVGDGIGSLGSLFDDQGSFIKIGLASVSQTDQAADAVGMTMLRRGLLEDVLGSSEEATNPTTPEHEQIVAAVNGYAADNAFIQVTDGGSTAGTDDRDFIVGLDGNGALSGGSGDDLISGGAGHDDIDGGADNDILLGGVGADSLVGGDGADTLFGGDGSDILIGDANDTLDGGAGNDVLQGEPGATFVWGRGYGHDFIEGPFPETAGVRIIFKDIAPSDLEIFAAKATVKAGPQGEQSGPFESTAEWVLFVRLPGGQDSLRWGDSLFENSRLEFADGTVFVGEQAWLDYAIAHAHKLYEWTEFQHIDEGYSEIVGELPPLDDRLPDPQKSFDEERAGPGRNMAGGAGNDTLTGGTGNDTLTGAAGADTLDGGEGSDIISYEGSSSSVTVDLEAGTGSGGDADGDVLIDVESVVGSSQDDALTGNADANTLVGLSGADTLTGGDGDDTLVGGAGGDVLDGGVGMDAVSYEGSAGAISVDLLTGTASGGDAQGDTLADVENVIGGQGDDLLVGSADDNTLNGSDGNDTLIGGEGADFLVGGSGTDTVSYALSAAAVIVTLESSGSGGDADGDFVTGVENVLGSAFDDIVSGNIDANFISSGQGNDILNGNFGDDTLEGGVGDDTLTGSLGADTIDGGAGADTAKYDTSTAGVVVDLSSGVNAGGDAEGDILVSIENVLGSEHDDMLTGDSGANVLNGFDGNDILEGKGGADILNGGGGIDTASYVSAGGGVVANLTTGFGSNGDAQGDQYLSIENLTGSAFADTLVGSSGANALNGGGGNDSLDGKSGDDTLIGGAGDDVIMGGAGNDIYMIGRGSGLDTIRNGDTSSSLDQVLLATGVDEHQLWFSRSGNDLVATIIGTNDRAVIQGWYATTPDRVDQFRTSDGHVLLGADVQQLVDAMASFAPPASGATDLPPDYAVALNPVIAAAWHNAA